MNKLANLRHFSLFFTIGRFRKYCLLFMKLARVNMKKILIPYDSAACNYRFLPKKNLILHNLFIIGIDDYARIWISSYRLIQHESNQVESGFPSFSRNGNKSHIRRKIENMCLLFFCVKRHGSNACKIVRDSKGPALEQCDF